MDTPATDGCWKGHHVILHADMDAFFAQVEQRDHPEFQGKPIIVGGAHHHREGEPYRYGVVSTASYEARRFGVHSAMPLIEAVRLCPDAIVVPVDMERYRTASRAVLACFESVTDTIEPVSIDEAYLDITGSLRRFGSPEEIGRNLQATIYAETHLTCSIGIASTKLVAKIASDARKPKGLVIVPPGNEQAFLDPLPAVAIPGIGPKTVERLASLGVHTVAEGRTLTLGTCQALFGTAHGRGVYRSFRGEDDRIVTPAGDPRSLSREETFLPPLATRAEMADVIRALSTDVARRLRAHHLLARTCTITLRTSGFVTTTHQCTLPEPTDDTVLLTRTATALFDEKWNRTPLRLIGVGTSELTSNVQGTLFSGESKDRALDTVVDALQSRFGKGAVSRGVGSDHLLHDLDGARRDRPEEQPSP